MVAVAVGVGGGGVPVVGTRGTGGGAAGPAENQ